MIRPSFAVRVLFFIPSSEKNLPCVGHVDKCAVTTIVGCSSCDATRHGPPVAYEDEQHRQGPGVLWRMGNLGADAASDLAITMMTLLRIHDGFKAVSVSVHEYDRSGQNQLSTSKSSLWHWRCRPFLQNSLWGSGGSFSGWACLHLTRPPVKSLNWQSGKDHT